MVNALSKGKNIIHFLNVLETKLAAVVEVMSVLEVSRILFIMLHGTKGPKCTFAFRLFRMAMHTLSK